MLSVHGVTWNIHVVGFTLDDKTQRIGHKRVVDVGSYNLCGINQIDIIIHVWNELMFLSKVTSKSNSSRFS